MTRSITNHTLIMYSHAADRRLTSLCWSLDGRLRRRWLCWRLSWTVASETGEFFLRCHWQLCAVILVIQIEICQCGQCVAPDWSEHSDNPLILKWHYIGLAHTTESHSSGCYLSQDLCILSNFSHITLKKFHLQTFQNTLSFAWITQQPSI